MTAIFVRPSSLPRRMACTPATRIRVLVIDDHEFVRRGLAAMIDAEPDMECCGAVAAAGLAPDAVARRRPNLVMVDISLRRGAALELVQRLRSRHPSIRIVALARYQENYDNMNSPDVGAAVCVPKLEMAPRVLQAIRRAYAAPARPPEPPPGRRPEGGAYVDRPRLSSIEANVVDLIGRGAPDRAIAVRLGLSVAMVEAHRRRIRTKLNLPSATELVEFCVRMVQGHGGAMFFGL